MDMMQTKVNDDTSLGHGLCDDNLDVGGGCDYYHRCCDDGYGDCYCYGVDGGCDDDWNCGDDKRRRMMMTHGRGEENDEKDACLLDERRMVK